MRRTLPRPARRAIPAGAARHASTILVAAGLGLAWVHPAAGQPVPPPAPEPVPTTGDRAGGDTTRSATASGLSPAELDALTAEVASRLRCPVCRNQSVLESSAELSREMQDVIRERLAAGESPEEVKAYFVARYGEWILLKPEARGINLLVYLLPALFLVAGAFLLRNRLGQWRRRAAAGDGPATSRSPGTAAGGEDGLATSGAPGVAGAGAALRPGGTDGAGVKGGKGRETAGRTAGGPPHAPRDEPLAGARLSDEDERWLDEVIREH